MFRCFHVSPGSAEARGIWGGIEKRLLIAYFIGNIFAKKCQNPFTCVKVIANRRCVVFETRCRSCGQFISHRSIPNLSFTSKVVERMVSLHPGLSCMHNLFLTKQLSCHQGHPTETEMPCVYLVRAVDSKLVMTSSCTVWLLIRATTPRW